MIDIIDTSKIFLSIVDDTHIRFKIPQILCGFGSSINNHITNETKIKEDNTTYITFDVEYKDLHVVLPFMTENIRVLLNIPNVTANLLKEYILHCVNTRKYGINWSLSNCLFESFRSSNKIAWKIVLELFISLDEPFGKFVASSEITKTDIIKVLLGKRISSNDLEPLIYFFEKIKSLIDYHYLFSFACSDEKYHDYNSLRHVLENTDKKILDESIEDTYLLEYLTTDQYEYVDLIVKHATIAVKASSLHNLNKQQFEYLIELHSKNLIKYHDDFEEILHGMIEILIEPTKN